MDCPECGEFNSMLAKRCEACGRSLASGRSQARARRVEPRVSSKRSARRDSLPVSHHLAAWLLAGQSVSSVGWLMFGGEAGPWPGSNAYVVAAFVDAILAVHLFTGARRRVLSLVIARAAFGGLLGAVVAILARSYLEAAAFAATNAAIAFLLTLDAPRRTQNIVTSIGALGVMGSLWLGIQHQLRARAESELAEEKARGGPVVGKALGYRFHLPAGWTEVEGTASTDVAFSQSSLEAVLQVYVIPIRQSSACIDTAIASLLDRRELIAERALPKFGDRARMLRIRWTEDGRTSDAWAASFLTPDHVIQVLGAAPSPVFAAAGPDIEHVIDSFELPANAATSPPNAGALTGAHDQAELGFSMRFPPNWYRRPSSARDEPGILLRAFRPYRCADVMVETRPAPVPFTWKPLEQALLAVIGSKGELDVLERRIAGADSLTLRATVRGKPHPIDVIARLQRVKRNVVVLRAFAPRPAFGAMERELRAILDSFEQT